MLIDGKQIAKKILDGLTAKVAQLKRPPKMAAVVVGDPLTSSGHALRKFVEQKKIAAEKVRAEVKIYEFPETISTGELREKLNQIARAKTTAGVIIELPLPPHLNTQYLLNTIPPEKDVDVLSQKSQGAFFADRSPILPLSVEAVKSIFAEHNIDPKGKRTAIFGYGLLVGRPLAHWLMREGATVTVINEFTENPKELSLLTDIVISGVGKPNIVTGDMVKEGAIVIDFGFSTIEKGEAKKIVGDVDFENVSKKAALITPVPGGVGPIVVAAAIKNLYELAILRVKP